MNMSGDWVYSPTRSPTIYSSPIQSPTPSPTSTTLEDDGRFAGQETTSIPANQVNTLFVKFVLQK